ncbi:MAG: DUF4880 domain-containing protein, partial [Opitutaceae bacterium]
MSAAAEPTPSDPIAAVAAAWLARRDRGFTPAEQDEFLLWLAMDPRHRAAIARLERTWNALDGLAAWETADAAVPNPDLLAPPRRDPRWRRALWPSALALAAAVTLMVGLAPLDPRPPVAAPAPVAGLRVIPRPEPMALEDGSLAQVNHGGRLELAFAPEERRVRLTEGEAHFTVRREPARPFVVEAGA